MADPERTEGTEKNDDRRMTRFRSEGDRYEEPPDPHAGPLRSAAFRHGSQDGATALIRRHAIAGDPYGIDLAGVRDILERIAVQHHEVGPFSRLESAELALGFQ
jgi:hypothetical protein